MGRTDDARTENPLVKAGGDDLESFSESPERELLAPETVEADLVIAEPAIAAMYAGTPWQPDLWTGAFLDAIADEAAAYLQLLFAMERAWLAAREAVPARRATSHTPAAIDLMAATPLLSATTLAQALGISLKSAIALLERCVAAGVAWKCHTAPAAGCSPCAPSARKCVPRCATLPARTRPPPRPAVKLL